MTAIKRLILLVQLVGAGLSLSQSVDAVAAEDDVEASVPMLPIVTDALRDFHGRERWWKGNTHAHSWWSDGDMPPELIADWYKQHGYQFLVLSDHNIMQQGEKWYPVDRTLRAPAVLAALQQYESRFGPRWVELRGELGAREVKLKTLDEFRSLFEEPERFIFLRGEEITDGFGRHPVHLNGVNLVEPLKPAGGSSVAETIQNNIDQVVAQSEKFSQPMLVHLNHPNFHYAQTAEDFFDLDHKPGDGFFEMYNGHAGVRNYGDERHESTERMWDIVLSKRLGEFGRSVIYGVATDDSHDYTRWGLGLTNPGRGWMMVRSQWLTPNMITSAIKRGDFYNSTGVTLRRLDMEQGAIDLEVEAEPGVEYTIEFVGTLQSADLEGRAFTGETHEHEGNIDHGHTTIHRYSDDVGRVLLSVQGPRARYEVKGNEIYVRARIISNKLHPNPFAAGDVAMAWTQPLVVLTNQSER